MNYLWSILIMSNICHLQKVIYIQKWYRGSIVRLKRLPLILYKIQKYLKSCTLQFSSQTNDGRVNSSLDENIISNLLLNKFQNNIRISKIRNWYDLLVFDYYYGWLPVNIKTTNKTNSDNVGNLAICVYAYTDYIHNTLLDLEKVYKNGEMSEILVSKIIQKKYNRINKKDYYFLVLNKNNSENIIINSVKGLTTLTPNANNLPFQVSWKKNEVFVYDKISVKLDMFIKCLQKPAISWKEKFIVNIRKIQV